MSRRSRGEALHEEARRRISEAERRLTDSRGRRTWKTDDRDAYIRRIVLPALSAFLEIRLDYRAPLTYRCGGDCGAALAYVYPCSGGTLWVPKIDLSSRSTDINLDELLVLETDPEMVVIVPECAEGHPHRRTPDREGPAQLKCYEVLRHYELARQTGRRQSFPLQPERD